MSCALESVLSWNAESDYISAQPTLIREEWRSWTPNYFLVADIVLVVWQLMLSATRIRGYMQISFNESADLEWLFDMILYCVCQTLEAAWKICLRVNQSAIEEKRVCRVSDPDNHMIRSLRPRPLPNIELNCNKFHESKRMSDLTHAKCEKRVISKRFSSVSASVVRMYRRCESAPPGKSSLQMHWLNCSVYLNARRAMRSPMFYVVVNLVDSDKIFLPTFSFSNIPHGNVQWLVE